MGLTRNKRGFYAESPAPSMPVLSQALDSFYITFVVDPYGEYAAQETVRIVERLRIGNSSGILARSDR